MIYHLFYEFIFSNQIFLWKFSSARSRYAIASFSLRFPTNEYLKSRILLRYSCKKKNIKLRSVDLASFSSDIQLLKRGAMDYKMIYHLIYEFIFSNRKFSSARSRSTIAIIFWFLDRKSDQNQQNPFLYRSL